MGSLKLWVMLFVTREINVNVLLALMVQEDVHLQGVKGEDKTTFLINSNGFENFF